jgi:hypothetical protein
MCTQTVPHRPNTRGMVAAGCTCFWRRRCGPGHDASQWQHGRQPGGAGEASQNPSEIRTKLGGTLDTLSRTCGMIGGSMDWDCQSDPSEGPSGHEGRMLGFWRPVSFQPGLGPRTRPRRRGRPTTGSSLSPGLWADPPPWMPARSCRAAGTPNVSAKVNALDRGARSTRPAARADTTRTPAITANAVSSSNVGSHGLARSTRDGSAQGGLWLFRSASEPRCR